MKVLLTMKSNFERKKAFACAVCVDFVQYSGKIEKKCLYGEKFNKVVKKA